MGRGIDGENEKKIWREERKRKDEAKEDEVGRILSFSPHQKSFVMVWDFFATSSCCYFRERKKKMKKEKKK